MSRIGKAPITVPSGVEVVVDKSTLTVKGPKGTLTQTFLPKVKIQVEAGIATVEAADATREAKSLHGLYRTLLYNMVMGVSKGWTKELDVVGTGFRAALQGQNLQLALGFSHPVVVAPLPGVSFTVAGNKITVSGADKQLVGQMAADIRKKRKPDAYKGKGVRYTGEVLRLKAGKAKKAGAK